jgi:O-acetyl-ADP-ribose deacetylase (regulator of RNase III)
MLGTGGAIREAGGWVIQEECRKIIDAADRARRQRWLAPGSAVLTGAGTLPFRGIIHAVAIDAFHDSTPAIIRNCVRNALDLVAGLSPPIERLGMPVFASGHGKLAFDDSLYAMLDELAAGVPETLRTLLIVANRDERADRARQILCDRGIDVVRAAGSS